MCSEERICGLNNTRVFCNRGAGNCECRGPNELTGRSFFFFLANGGVLFEMGSNWGRGVFPTVKKRIKQIIIHRFTGTWKDLMISFKRMTSWVQGKMINFPLNSCARVYFRCSSIFFFTRVWAESSRTRPRFLHSLRLKPSARHTICPTEAPVTLKKFISVSLNLYLEVHHILCNSHGTFQNSVWCPCHWAVTWFRTDKQALGERDPSFNGGCSP